MLPGQYGNSYQIVQGPGFVAIRYEMVHDTRVIPIGNIPRAASQIRSDMGVARGRGRATRSSSRTTNFKGRSAYRNANPDTLKLTERFTRTAQDKVEWTVTVDDPATWSRPWTFAIPLTLVRSLLFSSEDVTGPNRPKENTRRVQAAHTCGRDAEQGQQNPEGDPVIGRAHVKARYLRLAIVVVVAAAVTPLLGEQSPTMKKAVNTQPALTAAQALPLTCAQAWIASEKDYAKMRAVVISLAKVSLVNRDLTFPNQRDAGVDAGKGIAADCKADPNALLFAIVDKHVRRVTGAIRP